MEKATESASSPNSLAAMFCAQAKRYQDKVLYRFRDLIASQEAIDAAGWLHTGDVGAADGEGFLRVTDRKKDLIVSSGGKKVAPQRLENLLKEDSLISQAVIVGAGKPHLSALITLDRKRVLEQAAEQGVDVDPDHLADQPWVQNQVRQIIQRTNKQLAPFEAIRNFSVLDKDFTVDNEELIADLEAAATDHCGTLQKADRRSLPQGVVTDAASRRLP